MNKVLKIFFIVLIVAGAGIAVLSDVPLADYLALSAAFVGAAGLCVLTYKKSEKKDWKVKASIILIAVGSFALGFIGVASDAIGRIISAVGGVVLLIFGIIAATKSE